MATEVALKRVEPSTNAFVSMKGSFDQIPTAFHRLFGWIGERGYVPAGPPVGVYFNDPGQVPVEDLRWEIHCPISGEVVAAGPDERGLGVRRMEGAEYASAIHRGPYDQVGPTWAGVAEWIARNGYEIINAPQEVYLSDPS